MKNDKAIKAYLNEISKTPLLTKQEEIELAALIKEGDEAAKELMIKANLRLVVKIAQGYMGIGLPLLDLISEGNIGLIKAVERFDPNKGGKLSTYGSWWIKQSIKRALANQSKTIRLPAHLVDKISKMRTITIDLAERLGRDPTNDEVGARMGVSAGMIAHWRYVSTRPTSLDAPIGEDEGSAYGDIIGDDRTMTPYQEINAQQKKDSMFKHMESLDEREKEILKYRYGLQGAEVETLESVGERFQITRERVRQIQNAAVQKLRRMMEEEARIHEVKELEAIPA